MSPADREQLCEAAAKIAAVSWSADNPLEQRVLKTLTVIVDELAHNSLAAFGFARPLELVLEGQPRTEVKNG
jgi:hypothetical protein